MIFLKQEVLILEHFVTLGHYLVMVFISEVVCHSSYFSYFGNFGLLDHHERMGY